MINGTAATFIVAGIIVLEIGFYYLIFVPLYWISFDVSPIGYLFNVILPIWPCVMTSVTWARCVWGDPGWIISVVFNINIE